MLEKQGYDVAVAGNGREAIDTLSENAFDLVISEVRMPVLDGIGLIEEINMRGIDVSVVFLTAHGEVESYMDLMNMGAFDYINKPLKEQGIVNLVRRALEESRERHNTSCI